MEHVQSRGGEGDAGARWVHGHNANQKGLETISMALLTELFAATATILGCGKNGCKVQAGSWPVDFAKRLGLRRPAPLSKHTWLPSISSDARWQTPAGFNVHFLLTFLMSFV